jgi:hypothetical protein
VATVSPGIRPVDHEDHPKWREHGKISGCSWSSGSPGTMPDAASPLIDQLKMSPRGTLMEPAAQGAGPESPEEDRTQLSRWRSGNIVLFEIVANKGGGRKLNCTDGDRSLLFVISYICGLFNIRCN